MTIYPMMGFTAVSHESTVWLLLETYRSREEIVGRVVSRFEQAALGRFRFLKFGPRLESENPIAEIGEDPEP